MARFTKNKKKRSSFSLVLILTLILATAGGYIFIKYFEGSKPQIETLIFPAWIGKTTNISFNVTDTKSGLRSISVVFVQENNEKQVFVKEYPQKKKGMSDGHFKETINIEIDAKTLGLKEGDALLNITAVDYSMRHLMKGNITELSQSVVIDTTPPKIGILHSERYITPGGSGIVIYSVDSSTKSGVQMNGNFHPGFPLIDESEGKYVAYIAMPFDAKSVDGAVIMAEDSAGNITEKPFAPIVNSPNQKLDKIYVDDGFLAKKIPEFEPLYPEMEGDMVQKYLYANSEVRRMNNKKIHDLCMNPESKQLWSGRFLRMAGSGKAGFADHRTYYYQGKDIDKQVHLGMDIASTRHAEIKAAGTGKVIFSDYLGIYGNMVMLDHGQGVFSLYSHLSQSNVSPGDMLNKGDILGNTGNSGMAGGDHLHFSMLVNGVFVMPKEWWDQHWIDVTIATPLVDAKF
jgi:hypothetical protein